MQVTLKDTNASLDLNEDLFASGYNEGLVHQAVTCYLNNARSGNSAQKTRSEVRGGGRKPWAQKGTGRARAGTIRSPLWRSGGVTFASKRRDYSQKLNKKMYKAALRSIFAELHRLNRLVLISEFKMQTHKTKDFLEQMKKLDISNALIIADEINKNEFLSSRNLINFEVCDVQAIDPVRLLKFEHVIVTEKAIKVVEEQLV